MAWVIWVMALAAWVGVWWVTGAMPTETALLTWASWVVMRAGRWAACQPAGSRLLIFADMTAPRTALTLAMTPLIAMETNERRKPVLKERHRILLGSNTVRPPSTCFRRTRCSARLICGGRV